MRLSIATAMIAALFSLNTAAYAQKFKSGYSACAEFKKYDISEHKYVSEALEKSMTMMKNREYENADKMLRSAEERAANECTELPPEFKSASRTVSYIVSARKELHEVEKYTKERDYYRALISLGMAEHYILTASMPVPDWFEKLKERLGRMENGKPETKEQSGSKATVKI